MYFTKEDLEQIKNYIIQNGVKDSEFEKVDSLSGEELFTLVDQSGNKIISATSLRNHFSESNADFLKSGIQVVDTIKELDKFDTKLYGNLVFVKSENAYYSYSTTNEWEIMLKLYEGNKEPKDSNVLWVDYDDSISLDANQDKDIENIKKAIASLETKYLKIDKIINIGVVPGKAIDSYRRVLMNSATPELPIVPEVSKKSFTPLQEEKPNTLPAEPTVLHNCVKQDTSLNFSKNRKELIDGEMLFYTDRKRFAVYSGGKFYTIVSQDSEGGGTGGGLSVDDLYNLALDYLIFNSGKNKYKVKIQDNGKWSITPYNKDVTLPGSPLATWGTYVSHLLCINSVFCGGEGSEDSLVSHNFIELANGSKKDINLNGLYLLYTDGTKESSNDIGFNWKVLPLSGVIKAGSTFIIRGAQCNTLKSCFIKVENYDMEWVDNGQLIQFKQGPSSFYLCAGTGFLDLLNNKTLNNPWNKNKTLVGYIDSCGFGQGAVVEGPTAFLVESDWNKTLFIRWYMLEPAKQGNKAYDKRKTVDLWTYIDLEKQTTKEGNSILYYYSDFLKEKYTPKSTSQDKDFFTVKTKFKEDKPNMINITFGIQATDAGSGATRCFNWISVGYFDEFIEYRKKETNEWIRQYSFEKSNAENSSTIAKFIEYYLRLRWCTSDGTWVTSHKAIIRNLTSGVYEYRIGRDNDSNYMSDILEFTVKSNTEVTNFSFIQISDLQGFNWQEYTAWEKSAYMINKTEKDYNFTINTGDITLSGNRPSEWLDYYNGRKYLRDKEEMFSIGNNDLCGHNSTELTDGNDATSKYNHINILRYYTFEMNPNNEHYLVTWNNNKYPLYSVYSFNYGDYHFVSLNSEIAIASSKMYKDWLDDTYGGDASFAQAANAEIEAWLEKDLELWKGKTNPIDCSKCIVYCHEMPFTIVTWGFMNGSSARAGSRLNTLNTNGLYRFSRIFKKRGIRLVMGGHKHTYCITKPIYDAPADYLNGNNINPSADLMGPVTDTLSRKPVIQVTSSKDVLTSNFARYEVVPKINAPTYVMTQATGYKLVSNKELPSGDQYVIPWLLAYIKAKNNAATPTENVFQHRPMYIRYDLSNTEIKVTAKQVHNIWDVNIDKNTKSFNINKQLSTLEVKSMTLQTTSESDKTAYGITGIESYTITL